MIKANFNTYNNYVTDSLYQWDLNQDLVINGLNLSVAPEIHFANANMDRAIVKQSTLSSGVVTVRIPNSLLQEALTIKAYVGVYEDTTFTVIETIEIPVIAKARPSDYFLTDTDEEIYSFKALENRITNIVANANKTEGNSELVDIRIGHDNIRYASAGEAVRRQIGNLKKSLASPYNFKGSCLSSELPINAEINDTWYCTDLKYRMSWNGAEWCQSSLNESEYEDELNNIKQTILKKNTFNPIITASYDDDNHNYLYANEIFEKWHLIGVEKVVFCIYLDGDNCSIQTDLEKLIATINLAKETFVVDTVKLHCVRPLLASDEAEQEGYLNSLNTIMQRVDGLVDTIIVLNERGDVVRDAPDFLGSVITTVKSGGYKVGISCSGPIELTVLYTQQIDLYNSLDVIGQNSYPSISSNRELTSQNDSVIAWESHLDFLKFLKAKTNKKLIISETGILPFYEFLANPWGFYTGGLTLGDQTIYEKFLYGLVSAETNYIDEVYLWFLREVCDPSRPESQGFDCLEFKEFISAYKGG